MWISSIRKCLWCFLLLAVVVLTVPLVGLYEQPKVLFNQHFIEAKRNQYGSWTVKENIQRMASAYTFAMNRLITSTPNSINMNDIDSVFTYVFSEIPYYALVYPTEQYYYFMFENGGRNYSGNFRLVELDKGVLSFAVFDTQSTRGKYLHKNFTSADGLSIESLGASRFKVSFNKKTVVFKTSEIHRNVPRLVKLQPEEEFVAKVEDESGIILDLIYNRRTRTFYYLLNEEKALVEHLKVHDKDILVGDRTRFAYYNDSESSRKILIGVSTWGVSENNYYDGPFDQVPPRLDLKEKIYAAYPYTQLLGVDLHGNFLGSRKMRVAISPYRKYMYLKELEELVESCVSKRRAREKWSCIAYDKKRDYHKSSPLFTDDGALKTKRGPI